MPCRFNFSPAPPPDPHTNSTPPSPHSPHSTNLNYTPSSLLSLSLTVVETAQADPNLRALVDAVVAGGLVQTLSGPGPFTVFAPIDQAFGALGDNILGKFYQSVMQNRP